MMHRPKPRKRNPKPIRLSDRDREIFKMIFWCDGIVARRQIEAMFFAGKAKSQARRRLRALFDHKYLNQPNEEQYTQAPEHIYWLDRKGYVEIERMLQVEPNRNLKKIRTFAPYILKHHLQVIDFRLKVMQDVKQHDELHLGRWITEGQFKSWRHRITYVDAEGKKSEKGVEPDGFFPIWVWDFKGDGKRKLLSFPFEIDRGTEQQAIVGDKLRAGATYLTSEVYRQQLSVESGRYLMVTTGWERAANMMETAKQAKIAWAWYFTTFEQAVQSERNILTDPIWRKANQDEPTSILPASALGPKTDT